MKYRFKILVFLIGLIFITQYQHLYAQNPTNLKKFGYNVTKTPTFGLKGGILLSTIKGDDALNQYAKSIGPQIGVTGAIYFHPQLSARGELNYEGKGALFDIHDLKMSLNYVSLPIYLKYNFTRNPEIYIYGGAYVSYLIAAKTKGTYEIKIGPDNINESIDENIHQYLNKIDAGVIAGIGVQGRFNNKIDIFLDYRYTQGFIALDNGTAEYRYNFNYIELWPEHEVDNPTNKSMMLTTGIIYFLDSR